jgi:hypothetical protein
MQPAQEMGSLMDKMNIAWQHIVLKKYLLYQRRTAIRIIKLFAVIW